MRNHLKQLNKMLGIASEEQIIGFLFWIFMEKGVWMSVWALSS